MPSKLFVFVKKYLIIIMLALLAIFSIFVKTSKPTPSPKTTIQDSLRDSPPFATNKTRDFVEYYSGEKENSNYTIYGEKEGLLLYKVIKDPKLFEFDILESYFNKYGEPDLKTFGPWSEWSGYISYVYLNNGLIVTGHPNSQNIAEEWYINKGLSVEEFYNIYGEFYSPKKPAPKNQH